MKPEKIPLTLVTLLVIAVNSFAALCQNTDQAIINSFIERQAKGEKGEEYPDARKVVYGDLNHDGVPELVVLYTIEGQGGSNLYLQYLAVFTKKRDKLTFLARADVGGKSRRAVELSAVERNAITLETLDYGPKDASCCPSLKGTTRYVLSGGRLLESKRRKTSAQTLSR